MRPALFFFGGGGGHITYNVFSGVKGFLEPMEVSRARVGPAGRHPRVAQGEVEIVVHCFLRSLACRKLGPPTSIFPGVLKPAHLQRETFQEDRSF